MKDKLIQYVDLLFAGTNGTEEMKQEILQNTLDRYDDLVAQGKSPEAAYSLAISGIGDIAEILERPDPAPVKKEESAPLAEKVENSVWRKLVRAGAVFLYIISAIPLIVLSEMGMETLGLCGTIGIAAVATALIIIGSSGGKKKGSGQPDREEPQHPAYKIIDSVLTVVMFVLYFGLSFCTGAWHITWLVFPIFACIDGIVKAVFDLLEDKK